MVIFMIWIQEHAAQSWGSFLNLGGKPNKVIQGQNTQNKVWSHNYVFDTIVYNGNAIVLKNSN